MAFYETHEEQRFCWADLRTADTSAGKQFYGGLLGWDFKDMLMPDGRIMYTVARLNGYDVAGMSELMPEQIKAGMPAFQNSYIRVEDVRASLAQCLELCAQLMNDAIDIPNAGSMAMVMEPNGALFSLWQPAEHVGMQVRNQ